jgi:large conductance mechanosensitive channel
MGFFQEFKQFAMRGNVIDLAVGVVIGAAFGKIVSSLVSDIHHAGDRQADGGLSFSEKFVALDGKSYATLAEAKAAGAAVITYGNFIDAIIQFVIVAFAIFVVVRQINN